MKALDCLSQFFPDEVEAHCCSLWGGERVAHEHDVCLSVCKGVENLGRKHEESRLDLLPEFSLSQAEQSFGLDSVGLVFIPVIVCSA
jgi:hypothetical protein